MNPLLSAAIGSMIRWALALGAGYLVKAGIWTGSDAQTYVAASSMALLSLLWSLYQKWQQHHYAVSWWPRRVALVLLVLLLPATLRAQVGPDTAIRDAILLQSQVAQHRVDVLSTVTVAAGVALPCLMDRSWRCVKNETLHVGIAAVSSEITKRVVHRERPNGVDDKSFWSEHTAIACAATLNTKAWMICPAVAVERIASDWHWPTDTMAGAGFSAAVVFTIHPW